MQPKNPLNSSILSIFTHPYLLLVLAPLLWGGNITAGKLAVGEISPEMLTLGRWVGAALILLPFAIPGLKRDWSSIQGSLPILFLFGAIGFSAFNMLMYIAALFTSAVNASIEQAAIPVFVLIGNFLFFAVKPKLLQTIGLIITVFGVIFVATHGHPERLFSLEVNLGDALVLLACVFYAIYSLLLRYRPDVSWISFIFVTVVSAAIAALFFSAFTPGGIGETATKISQITPKGWLILCYVMLLPSIVAQLCYAKGLQLVGPNRASIFINLLPVFGTILSVLIIGEQIQSYHLVAAFLVIVGIMIAEYAVRRRV